MSSPLRSAPAGAAAPVLLAVDRALQADDRLGAEQLACRALDAGHIHPALLELRAAARMRGGCLREALDDLQRAHTLAPKSAAILSALAQCLNTLGRPKQAILACGDALAIDDTLAGAWAQKGRAHALLNQPERARACYSRAARLDPECALPAQTQTGGPEGPPAA